MNIEEVRSLFKRRIAETIEKRVPTKQTTTRHTNPWITTHIKRAIRRKQRAFKKAKLTGKKRDRDRYRRLQHDVKRMIKKANKDYLLGTVSHDYKDNAKKFWSFVKAKRQDSTGVAPLKNKDGFLQSSSTAKANILNEQFVSVFTDEDMTDMPDKGPSDTPSMEDISVNWKGIHKLIMNLNIHKSTGPDRIPSFILKVAATETSTALAKIFQLSLNTGEVPQDWREASVVPLFKKGDKHQPANYRPVSLTSVVCKLLEHVVHSSVMKHFETHSILKDNQHGFRKKRSCETQLITTIHEIASNIAQKDQVDVILLDFAKAFDKVPHQRLLQKLTYYGVRGKTNNWIGSFLRNRHQQVVLDGATSTTADVLSGVPQGTVLGPLLFLAYINDLPDMITSSSSKLFADDSMLFRVILDDIDRASLQSDLSALEDWERQWQMSFNPSKCSVIRIVPKGRQPIETQYQLHGQTLDVVEASKYLGVTLTERLSWDTHISATCSKGHKTLGFLRRNLRDCSPDVKAGAYKAMVRPILEYASTVWDPAQTRPINQIEQVQRRAARFVFNDYQSKTPGCVTNMLSVLNWEPLAERRRVNRLAMMYKIENGLVDINMDQYCRRGDTRTRGSHRLYQERLHDQALQESFFPRTAREWNRLPTSIVTASSVDSFKAMLNP